MLSKNAPLIVVLLLCLTEIPQASVADHTSLSFDWQQQQRILTPGLEVHNITEGSGCVTICRIYQHSRDGPEVGMLPTASFKERSFYWSDRQAEVTPVCIVQPKTSEEVAAIVLLVRKSNCLFAVKSGGHGAFEGASNIATGLTIDLSLLDELTLSDDRTITYVGAGNRWINVYEYLTPRNLSVLGGRVAEVGVGGFTLGGGISFFSNRYGWALDGVRRYELITAEGEILQVDADTTPDLFWALRGGGNNFGIVTRFDLDTFPQGDMWGGVAYSDVEYAGDVVDAFVDFAFSEKQDLDAHAYIFLDFTHDRNRLRAGSVLAYARPIEDPPAFGNFTKIPTVQSSLRFTNIIGLTQELQDMNPNHLRWSYSTATFVFSKEMVQVCLEVFVDESESIKSLYGVVPVLVLQLITKDTTSRFTRNGGNALGIEPGSGPLLLLNFPVKWENAEDDGAVLAAAQRIRDRTVEEAKRHGLHHRYLYQNYADISQEVFASYGEKNLKRLREISKTYDPDQIFQRLQPGYFKL